MDVIKRNGDKQKVSFDKILVRIQRLANGYTGEKPESEKEEPSSAALLNVVCEKVAQETIRGVYDGVKTTELDVLAAETAASLTSEHPEYEYLASRITLSNLHKETKADFLEVMSDLYSYVNPKNNKHSPLIADDVFALVQKNAERIQSELCYVRDFGYTYFGFQTLAKSYLLKLNGKIVERPQHMLMRVSLGIHKEDLESVFKTYHLMSNRIYTHASPTLFNAGTPRPQMSSCFLLTMTEDSILGIYETLTRCAIISKAAGGIGLNISDIRASGSYIAGTNGNSNGLVPMLRVYNATSRYVDQGGGKRKGAFAMYIEPWHADIFDVLDLKKNNGVDELRARDLFYALWTPDIFMRRIDADEDWSLMCPNECPGLTECWGGEFDALYEKYEREGKVKKTVKARKLWYHIFESQIETGTPYMLYKDSANKKSNQQNLGTIKGSNLCTEIIEYTSKDEVAVCNLASMSLKEHVKTTAEGRLYFDHQSCYLVARHMTRSLNKVIDQNYYPLKEAETSNMRHRPIGLGVQGLAETFFLMRYPFDSLEAAELNKEIFETIYFAAVTESMELAKKEGPYSSFEGSPASKGQLQFDLWGVTPSSGRWDWVKLKENVVTHGLRNSLLVAPMPTASTAQILGNTECFEPISSNIYSRAVLSGTFPVVNKYLVDDLIKLNMWNAEMKNAIVDAGGSIQGIPQIPKSLKDLYKTVWEIKQKSIVQMAVDRGPYIDQSQSLNIHMEKPSYDKMTSLHFYAWERGLKGSSYYIRTKNEAEAIKFTVTKDSQIVGEICTKEEGCISCGA